MVYTFPHHVLAWHAPYGRAVRCRGNGLGRPRGLVYTWYDVALLCIVWSVLVWYGTAWGVDHPILVTLPSIVCQWRGEANIKQNWSIWIQIDTFAFNYNLVENVGELAKYFFYKCSSICLSVHLLQLNEAMKKIISIPPAKKLIQSWPACSWTPPVSSSSPPTPSSSLVALAWSKDGSLSWWTFINKKWLSPLPQTCWTYWPDGFCSQRSFWLHQLQSLQRRCSQA